MNDPAHLVTLDIGASRLTAAKGEVWGEARLTESGSQNVNLVLEGYVDAATVLDDSYWAVGGTVWPGTTDVQVDATDGPVKLVNNDTNVWLAAIPVGPSDGITVSFLAEGRLLHQTTIHIADYLPHPPTAYGVID